MKTWQKIGLVYLGVGTAYWLYLQSEGKNPAARVILTWPYAIFAYHVYEHGNFKFIIGRRLEHRR